VPNLGISTNATLLDSKRAEAILQSPLDTIMIAIDGTRKEVYEKIRISSRFTFEEVCENVGASSP
jgi:sulfatase maturation enzyme AslB (radical SAM superfamily)